MKVLVLLLFQIIFVSSVWAECTLKLRVNQSPPYYFLDGDEYKGLFVEQARSIAKQIGCRVTTTLAPWSRSLLMLQEGTIDMMANMSITEERKEFLRFLGPHHFEEIVLVVAENSDHKINTHADLLNLPGQIGIERDAYYGPKFQKLMQNPEAEKSFVWFTGEKQFSLDERVRLGRLVGFFDVAKPQYKTKGLKYHSFVINSSPVYFGLSKKSVGPETFNKLQSAMENGGKQMLEEIEAKYK